MGERLDSWKGIAAYLGRDVRTVQRWALGRGLPVHRVPGGGEKPRVFGLKPELDGWMRGARAEGEPAVSVAVLPFSNLSGDASGRRFADGLAEDLINALVRVPRLRVTARTSSFAFAGRSRDVRHIARRLGTSWLVEGSVRRDGRRVRVSAQLVGAKDGFHVWSRCYERHLTDVFAIQDEIAAAIALALELKLAPERPAPRPALDAVAYDLWLAGREISQQYSPSSFAEARRCYEAAIARDPRFARPYFGLAELLFIGINYGLTASGDEVARAREAVARALDLDERFGEAHALSGALQGMIDYDWAGAEAAFRRALELSPGSSAILMQHAWLHLTPRMRLAEALQEAEQAVALDPLAPMIRGRLGLVQMAARQYRRATEECRAAVRLAPGLWWLRWFYATALLAEGRLGEGLRQARKVFDRFHHPMIVGAMALLYGRFLSARDKAEQLQGELAAIAAKAYVPPLATAFAFLGAGDERAFEWLERAIDARDPAVTQLPSMPMFDGIRDDPRFLRLLQKMNLGPPSPGA